MSAGCTNMVVTGTERIFRLREVVPTDGANTRRAQTFNIPLPHNSVGISSFCVILSLRKPTSCS